MSTMRKKIRRSKPWWFIFLESSFAIASSESASADIDGIGY